jgi:hypothetical protein
MNARRTAHDRFSRPQRPEVHDTFYACPNQGKMFVSEISIADPPIFL